MSFSFFSFLPGDSFRLSRAAPVAILPSALLLSDFRPVRGGRWQFSKCGCLIIMFCGQFTLGHGAHPFVAIARSFVRLYTHP